MAAAAARDTTQVILESKGLTAVLRRLGSLLLRSGERRLLRKLRSFAAHGRLRIRAHVTVVEANGEVESCFLLVVVEFAFEVFGAGGGPRAERHSQELICSPSFHVLLIEQVQEQILIPLN